MTASPELLRQGTQRRGRGFSLGFIGSELRASNAGGGIVARIGIASPAGRHTVELAPGETAPLPGGGSLRVIDIFVSPDGTQTAAAIEVHEGQDPASAPLPGDGAEGTA